MKKSKLAIEKFRILKLTNLSNIIGGTSIGNNTTMGDPETGATVDSEATTFTTDPNVPCPLTVYSDSQPHTSADPQNGSGVPTFNATLIPEP